MTHSLSRAASRLSIGCEGAWETVAITRPSPPSRASRAARCCSALHSSSRSQTTWRAAWVEPKISVAVFDGVTTTASSAATPRARSRASAAWRLPTPGSPVIITCAWLVAARAIALKADCIATDWPMNPVGSSVDRACRPDLASPRAAATAEIMSSRSKGLGRYSNTPPLAALIAVEAVACALITITGIWGRRRDTSPRFSRKLVPSSSTSASRRSPSPLRIQPSAVSGEAVART